MNESDSFNRRQLDKTKLRLLKAAMDDLEESIQVYTELAHTNEALGRQLSRSLVSAFAQTSEHIWKYIMYLAKVRYKEMIQYPVDSFKFAFRRGWITDEDLWQDILDLRNGTTHIYSKALARKACTNILNEYIVELRRIVSVIENE